MHLDRSSDDLASDLIGACWRLHQPLWRTWRFGGSSEGFTHKTLRQRFAALHKPGPKGYTAARMTYDLRRLRLKGLIKRIAKSHRYMLTALGRRVALFMSKSFARIVKPVLNRIDPTVPANAKDQLRRAQASCEKALDTAIEAVRIVA